MLPTWVFNGFSSLLPKTINYSTGESHMRFLYSWILFGHGHIARRTGFLQGGRALEIQPEPRSWREASGEHQNLPLISCAHDSHGYCWLSLGLGSTAGAEILEADVWAVLQSATDVVRP